MFRTVLTSLLAVLVLCGSAFAAEKTLIAAANPTWPPMEFLDENKNIIGYDRDIIAAIAEEIGMKSEFRNIAWDGIFASLESGQANVIASCVTITDKRKKAYVFSDPYYEVHQAVVVAKDSAIKKPEDLKGKKVGVQIGTTAIEALRKMNVDIDLRTYDEVGLVFEDMRNGRLDVVVCDDPVARYYASRKEGYKDLMKVAFLTEDAEYIGFVFSKDNAELAAQVNKGLKAIRENGKEKAIRNKWEKVLQPLLTPVIMLVLFFVFYAVLRLLVSMLVTVLGLVNKLPVIGTVNRGLGWLTGGMTALLDLYLVLCVVWGLVVITGGNLNVLNDTVMHSSLYYKAFNMFNPFL